MQRFNPATGPKRVKSRTVAWRVYPPEFYALRHAAKHLRKPEDFTSARFRKAKANVRNDLHTELYQIRASNYCPIEFAAKCWLRELADLRARVMQPDTYKATGANFRPLFLLWLEEQEIAASNPFHGALLLPDARDNEDYGNPQVR